MAGTTINLRDMGGTSQGSGVTAKADPASNYKIPDEVRKKYPQLADLILSTESMSEQERNYWFQIIPIMTEQQIEKLKGILTQEKEQLAKLDSEYEQELQKLNEKHLVEWREFETKKAREARKAAESKSEAEEKQKEEEILKQLNQI